MQCGNIVGNPCERDVNAIELFFYRGGDGELDKNRRGLVGEGVEWVGKLGGFEGPRVSEGRAGWV